MSAITIDWAEVGSPDEFYDLVFAQTEAPIWHGRNLNAIQDSWVTGELCRSGPPFDFVFRNSDAGMKTMQRFVEMVEEIAAASVAKHGGASTREENVPENPSNRSTHL